MLNQDSILQIENWTGRYLKEKIQKVIGSMKDELGGNVMAEFATLRPKMYSYLTDNSDENKKAKGTKNGVIKRKLQLDDYERF